MFESVLAVVISYLLGSLSGSLVLGRFRRVDIRQLGSGNAGGTNALRTQGFWFAFGVMVIDVGKGYLAAGWIPLWLGTAGPWVPVACGFAAVFGHCYPIWHGFRGGKGAATLLGTLLALNGWLLLPLLATWIVTLLITGYVGIATVLAMFSLIPAAWWQEESTPVLVYCIAVALFIAFTHRSNFRNLAHGTEHRFHKVRLSHWLLRRDRDE